MEDKKFKQLKNKVDDYKRFGYILLSLSMFLFIGLFVPSEGLVKEMPGMFIGGVFVTLTLAMISHRIAIKAEKKLYEESH